MRQIVVSVNGTEQQADVPDDMHLLEFLRETLGLTGTKCGCGYGACGACTVLLDGTPVRACTTHLSRAEGKSVETIEGLARDGQLSPIQQAFLEHEAFQCGFCTPGMILEVCGFLARLDGRVPEQAEVRQALRQHLCRCGSYQRIVAAVISAATKQSRSA
ncbi:(2Fe-2S)-binding protein [Stieleria sp. ICT_E10.1]|uniref:(2Fe-2S)-binding protein n=1 Tax=Stieleria sedimenti TaxID=2976331 RepID=UPI00217FA236|nr:(2Fe-2S)-binding protein [Stieleria sedimenti]MCS7468660.1 (2Fe-2S)-binding protein [Stieleria sedimenti]